jgi:hypothetical protein
MRTLIVTSILIVPALSFYLGNEHATGRKRIALVIGDVAYQVEALQTAANDAA